MAVKSLALFPCHNDFIRRDLGFEKFGSFSWHVMCLLELVSQMFIYVVLLCFVAFLGKLIVFGLDLPGFCVSHSFHNDVLTSFL